MKPVEFSDNIFKMMREGALLSADDGERANMMTVGWGGIGVLWNKDVCFVFVRPSRYTYDIIENSNLMALSFFDKKHRSALGICGTKSGRDIDKLRESGLTPVRRDGFLTFDEAYVTIKAKKLFYSDFNIENFLNKDIIERFYNDDDYHRVYACEIIDIEKCVHE